MKTIERAQKKPGLVGGGVGLAALAATDNLEIVKALGLISLGASFLSALMPTPDEISARWYCLAYNIIRRAALNAPWIKEHNGGASPGKNGG